MPRQRASASLLAALGMVGVGAGVWALDAYGPRTHVVFRPYLPPFAEIGHVAAGAAVGLSLCADAGARLGRDRERYRAFRLAVGCVVGGLVGIAVGALAAALADHRRALSQAVAASVVLAGTMLGAFCGAFVAFEPSERAQGAASRSIAARAVVACAFLAWVLVRQLDAFPSRGTLAERDAWARVHVREYPGLARFASQLPVVVGDLKRVVAVAPTGTDQHSYARSMDGDEMSFTLEVVGEAGRGTLRVDATFTEGELWSWRGGRWAFDGVATPVDVCAPWPPAPPSRDVPQ